MVDLNVLSLVFFRALFPFDGAKLRLQSFFFQKILSFFEKLCHKKSFSCHASLREPLDLT